MNIDFGLIGTITSDKEKGDRLLFSFKQRIPFFRPFSIFKGGWQWKR